VLDAQDLPTYSTVQLEKISGHSIEEAVPYLKAAPGNFLSFVESCFNILEQLAANQITHRDIRPENIIVRGHQPVLIDFGWAVSPEHPYYTPAPFRHQSPSCDLIGMGRVIAAAAGERYPQVRAVVQRMLQQNPVLPPPSLAELRRSFQQGLRP
jgi:serine/threonine protein kinase